MAPRKKKANPKTAPVPASEPPVFNNDWGNFAGNQPNITEPVGFSGQEGIAVASPSVVSTVSSGSTSQKNSPCKKNRDVKHCISSIKETPTIDYSFLSEVKFSPTKKAEKAEKSRTTERSAYIRMAVIPHGEDKAAVIRIEPASSKYDAWQEKCLYDDIRNKAEYTKTLNFERRTLKWVEGDEEKMNSKGYNIRLFVIPFEVIPSEETLKKMANAICQGVNSNPQNYNDLLMDPYNLFWTNNKIRWQQVISTADCLTRLFEAAGQPDSDFWFPKHSKRVNSFFAPGFIDENVARRLRAPNNMIYGYLIKKNNQQTIEMDYEEESDNEDVSSKNDSEEHGDEVEIKKEKLDDEGNIEDDTKPESVPDPFEHDSDEDEFN